MKPGGPVRLPYIPTWFLAPIHCSPIFDATASVQCVSAVVSWFPFLSRMEEGRAASKSPSLNIWLYSFYFPARSFCRHYSKFSCWKLLQKTEGTKTKATRCLSDVFSLPVHFEFFAVFSYCLHFAKFVCLLKRLQRLKQEWRKVQLGPGKHTAKIGLVCRNRKKISQIIKDYINLPFFLLIILCFQA